MSEKRNSRTRTSASNFEELVNNSQIFIDKTLMISEFVYTKCSTNFLVARPRKWGKTINLDMLRCFLSIDVQNGQSTTSSNSPDNIITSDAYKMFTKGYGKSNTQLKIAANKEILEEHLGKHPVIAVCLKSAKGGNFEEMVKDVLAIIGPLFEQHKFLLDNLKPESVDYREFNAIMNKNLGGDEHIVRGSLSLLMELLSKHFGGKRVFVLIDDYDAIYKKILLDWRDTEEIRRGLHIFGGMIWGAFDSLHKNKVLAAGNLIVDEYILDVDAIRSNTLKTVKFADKFGVTIAEANWAMQEYEIQIGENFEGNEAENSEYRQIIKWYNGYIVLDAKIRLLNINSFFQQLVVIDEEKGIGNQSVRFGSWWYNDEIILPKIAKCILNSNPLRKTLHGLAYEDLHYSIPLSETLVFSREDFGKLREASAGQHDDIIFKFFYALGYVTIDKQKTPRAISPPKHVVLIPNKEAREEIEKRIYQDCKDKFKWSGSAENLKIKEQS